ncbi:cell division protein FtsQ/DivIB, partial [Amnimonas aquatica]
LRFPWVATARVSRQWPDAVRVEIEEKQAVARWGADGLVSRQGEVFRPRAARGTDMLPVLQAPRAQAGYVLQQYQAMDALLRRVGLRIHRLELTDRMSWVLTLDGSVRVLVDAQDTLAKLERFTLLYDRQLSNEVANIASIDLRYRNGVAIGWRRAG